MREELDMTKNRFLDRLKGLGVDVEASVHMPVINLKGKAESDRASIFFNGTLKNLDDKFKQAELHVRHVVNPNQQSRSDTTCNVSSERYDHLLKQVERFLNYTGVQSFK